MQLLCVSLSRLWRKNIRRVDAELLLSYILVFYWFYFLALIGVLHLYTLFVQVANEPRWCLKIKRKLDEVKATVCSTVCSTVSSTVATASYCG